MGKEKRKESAKRGLLIMVSALLALLLTIWNPLQEMQLWFGDRLFIKEQPVDNRIKIIGIDERTLREFGPFADWSRQRAADIINAFDEEYAPAVIAFDINYFGNRDASGDAALEEACRRFGNVVMASYFEYSTRVIRDADGSLRMDSMYIEEVETPYKALSKVCKQGYTNTVQDVDNYVRRAVLSQEWVSDIHYNFAYEIYRAYAESVGEQIRTPHTNAEKSYGFDYTASPGKYEVYSFADVATGRLDTRVFKDSIVLVGAYAAGMMDQYMVPIAHNTVMNGVEVQANHVNALLSGRTYVEMQAWREGMLAALIVGIYMGIVQYGQFKLSIFSALIMEAGMVVSAIMLYNRGIYWGNLIPCLFVIGLLLYKTVSSYLAELIKKKKIMDVFRTYMAPQVVDELNKTHNYRIELGGSSRDVAVLFVDIRGFTSLSEKLTPVQVVEVLNRYLGGVTEAIFKNDGTLDKFIGDAVMAVYNAPLDVEDYCKRAVLTGIEIVRAVNDMNRDIRENYQIELACGVGIHCGKAIVGNIGCEYRMDYTAVGDTVNIAERLESIAMGGQILLSEAVYERVKDSFCASFVGSQSLKGRQGSINVFVLEEIDETGTGR